MTPPLGVGAFFNVISRLGVKTLCYRFMILGAIAWHGLAMKFAIKLDYEWVIGFICLPAAYLGWNQPNVRDESWAAQSRRPTVVGVKCSSRDDTTTWFLGCGPKIKGRLHRWL
ncbi:MAG: hypothetical protein KA214_08780, partial [Neisseriaceae bacterium]|nr:hypothetical protein [Neisseriaceae bacterium]